jgi:serine/threonine protein kinase
MTGQRIAQFEIVGSVGAGGMGEVFRARDTRLNRDVAVKVLPKDFVADAGRLRRFEQESKTQAALNHLNLLTIHDAGMHEGAAELSGQPRMSANAREWNPKAEMVLLIRVYSRSLAVFKMNGSLLFPRGIRP